MENISLLSFLECIIFFVENMGPEIWESLDFANFRCMDVTLLDTRRLADNNTLGALVTFWF